MVRQELLEILCCPETKEDVSLVTGVQIEEINKKIDSGILKNRGGEVITERIDSGLVRKDQRYLYPIRQDIPIMLIDEAIPLEGNN